MESRKIVFKETAMILIGQVICIAVMFGVYALLGRFTTKVLLGGIVGGVAATLNFFFMAISTSLAADKAEQDNVKGGKATVQGSYLIRMVVLFVVLFACIKSDWFDLLALLLPLVFVRPILSVGEFFRKSGDKKQ